jgi:hypothetical protein
MNLLDMFSPLIAAPVLPATFLLLLMFLWSLSVIALGGGLDHDGQGPFHFWNLFHGHGPVSGGHEGWMHWIADAVGDTLGALILVPSKWLNLQSVPLFLWLGAFALNWWLTSVLWWLVIDERWIGNPSAWMTGLLVGRNLACALPLTKLITHPLRGMNLSGPEVNSQSLVGQEAEICSYDATPESGQAKFKTGAAPLLLNVKTDGPHLVKGTRVWITHYDARKRVYLVSPTTTDS